MFSQPLKKRQRPVLKSNVVQMRQKCHPPIVPSPAHLSSVLTVSGNYRSKRQLHSNSPKVSGAVNVQGHKLPSTLKFIKYILQFVKNGKLHYLFITGITKLQIFLVYGDSLCPPPSHLFLSLTGGVPSPASCHVQAVL